MSDNVLGTENTAMNKTQKNTSAHMEVVFPKGARANKQTCKYMSDGVRATEQIEQGSGREGGEEREREMLEL